MFCWGMVRLSNQRTNKQIHSGTITNIQFCCVTNWWTQLPCDATIRTSTTTNNKDKCKNQTNNERFFPRYSLFYCVIISTLLTNSMTIYQTIIKFVPTQFNNNNKHTISRHNFVKEVKVNNNKNYTQWS